MQVGNIQGDFRYHVSAKCLFLLLRSFGWSKELEGDRPDHQHFDSALGSSSGQRPDLQGLLHAPTRRRRTHGTKQMQTVLWTNFRALSWFSYPEKVTVIR